MAIYQKPNGSIASLMEQPIYGNERVGIHYRGSGKEVYQLTDHLGNVRVVFEKNGTAADNPKYKDFYPFGMGLPGRNSLSANFYRYAFQGQELDSDTGKETFQLRIWDSRIGRWLTTDPYAEFVSPYLGMGNNPISFVDPDGGMTDCPDCPDPLIATIMLDEVVLTAGSGSWDFGHHKIWL